MKIKFLTLLALVWTMAASAQSQYAGIYSGTVVDTTHGDPNAGSFAVYIGTNGQATVVGYDVDSFSNYNGQAGGVAAQFNVPANGNWSFSSNNTIYGCSGSGLVTNGSFSGTLNFTNGDTVLLTNGYQQSPLGNFQNAAGYYSGTFSGTFGGQATSGPLISVLTASGQLTFSIFVNGALNDGGQGQLGSTNKFTTTNLTSGSVVSGILTNATLKIGGTVTNSSGSATFSMSRSNYIFQVATTNLPVGVTTVAYSQTLTAYGGLTNYTWGIISNGLQAGLSLSSAGVISGTPTTAGNTNFTVRATNALSATATQTLSLSIYSFSSSVTFAVTPAVVSNTYLGTITLLTSNLASGETVLVQKYLDLNTNGVIDGNDMLVQQFNLTDGQAGMVIGGVTNLNVPGDLNTTVSNITTTLNFNNGDFMQNLVGKYVYKLSSPIGHFAPITTNFTVTNFPYAQLFKGNVVSNSTPAITLSNAIVLLFPPPRAGHSGPGGNPLAGVVANNAGAYSIAAPAGTYTLTAFSTNYVTSFKTAPVLTLTNNTTFSNNLTATVATTNITGRMVDAANNNLGLPGVFMPVESTNGLIAIICTDTNGSFNVRVATNNSWKLGSSDQGLIVHGYVGWNNAIYTNSGATNVLLAFPMANALFYGTITNSQGNPLVGIDVSDYDTGSNLYSMDGYTDANGNYFVGALGFGSSDPWQVQISSDSSPTNYIFSQPQFNQNGGTNLTAGQAVLQNFTGIFATNLITGNVKYNNSTNIPVVGVWASGNGSVSNFFQYVDTDTNGNYSLSVPNGIWTVGLESSGGNDSLDSILGNGTYQPPSNQNVVINNNKSTNNFNVLPCGGISFVTATTLPVGEVNVYYDQFINAESCSSSLTWSEIGGSLPGGLSQAQNGQAFELSGTPGSSGTFIFTNQVNDGSHITNQSFTVSISNALQITTVSLPNGTNGSAYSQQLQASGGQPPYNTWTVTSGNLPANVNLTTNGLISGTAVASGTFGFTVGLTDNLGGNASQPLSLSLNATNNATPPPMGVTMAGGQVFICYPTSGSNFVLQTATNLNGPWVNASNGVPAISVLFSNTSSAAFFRLH